MKALIDFLKLLPASVQVAIVCLILGGGFVLAAESRYMTVDQFTKSYVLDLKSLIREYHKDLQNPDLTDRERVWIEEQIQLLIDELCYELPDDPYCDKEQ